MTTPHLVACVGSTATTSRILDDFACDVRDRRLIIVGNDKDCDRLRGRLGDAVVYVDMGANWYQRAFCRLREIREISIDQARELLKTPQERILPMTDRPIFECPGCGKDVALDTPHTADCPRDKPDARRFATGGSVPGGAIGVVGEGARDAAETLSRGALARIKSLALNCQPTDVPATLAHIVRICIDTDRAIAPETRRAPKP